MKKWAMLAGGALSTALLLGLALPPVGWWPLAWIALVPVLAASAGNGFFKGFVGGIGATLVLAWIAVGGWLYPIKGFEGDPTWTYLGCAMFGFVLALCAGAVGELKKITWRGALGVAALAVLLEYILTPVIPATIALTQSRVPGMLLLTTVTGIWGVAFLLWAINIFMVEALRTRTASGALKALAVLAVLAALGPVWQNAESGPTWKVSVVQSASQELEDFERLSRQGNPALAVWPEFGGMPFAPSGDTSNLRELVAKPGMPAIVTSFPDDNRPMPHNVASVISRVGESERYSKRRLFGGEKSMHTAGARAFSVPFEATNVGLNICFDSCFPAMIRETALTSDTPLIALPTIDPPAPHGFLAAMHAAFTPFRAAEMGVSVARADAYGYSHIVDPRGRILAEIPPNQEQSATALIPTQPVWTLYRVAGDWFLYACGVLLMALSSWWIIRGRKMSNEIEDHVHRVMNDPITGANGDHAELVLESGGDSVWPQEELPQAKSRL